MDRYLLNDILEERSYIEWRELIKEVNKEYHDKVYYGEHLRHWGECLRCRRSSINLLNWRSNNNNYRKQIYHLHCANNGYELVCLGIDLPKNY